MKVSVTTIKRYNCHVSVQRTANDTARVTYRSDVDGVLASQHSTVDGQVATFKAAVTTAENTARASCTATPNNGPAIRTIFVAALKSAHHA